MFYTRGLSFNLAKNPHYSSEFQFAGDNKIDGYVPTSYNKLRTTLLQQEKTHVERLLQPFKLKWKDRGVTIVTDGWSDPTRKPLINFMATSESAPMFLKALNCFSEVKDKFFIAGLMEEVIKEVGHEVQIITHNATTCKGTREIIEGMFPHIYKTPYVVQTFNLALKNISATKNVERNQNVYDKCSRITIIDDDALVIKHFIMNHNIRLSIFNKFSPLMLLSVVDTRASVIVILKTLKLIRSFQSMVISEEWSSYKEDDIGKATFVREIFLDEECGIRALMFYGMIKFCDTDKPCLHLVYEMWDSMIKKVKFEIYKKKKHPMTATCPFYYVVYEIFVAQ